MDKLKTQYEDSLTDSYEEAWNFTVFILCFLHFYDFFIFYLSIFNYMKNLSFSSSLFSSSFSPGGV